MTTGSEKRSARIELGIMIERSGKGGMRVAEDVTALSAVVTASKVAKSPLASRVITNSRFGIGLPVLASRLSLDFGEHLGIEIAVNAALSAIAS